MNEQQPNPWSYQAPEAAPQENLQPSVVEQAPQPTPEANAIAAAINYTAENPEGVPLEPHQIYPDDPDYAARLAQKRAADTENASIQTPPSEKSVSVVSSSQYDVVPTKAQINELISTSPSSSEVSSESSDQSGAVENYHVPSVTDAQEQVDQAFGAPATLPAREEPTSPATPVMPEPMMDARSPETPEMPLSVIQQEAAADQSTLPTQSVVEQPVVKKPGLFEKLFGRKQK